jgi:hypothetical protein
LKRRVARRGAFRFEFKRLGAIAGQSRLQAPLHNARLWHRILLRICHILPLKLKCIEMMTLLSIAARNGM